MSSYTPSFSASTPSSLGRRLAIRALQGASRWLDARATALALSEDRVRVRIGESAVEVSRIPGTDLTAVYVDGVRRFTFLQGLERL
jgi:hypothetical protein